MATTNFVQHNPSAANQQPDSDFDTDSLTTGGIGEDAIMPSDWMNKRWYQDSTFIAAFCQMLAAKGVSTSDANISSLAAVLATIQTNADVRPNMVEIAYSPTPTFDASATNGFLMNMGGNITSSTLVGISPYQILTFTFINPSSFTVVWPSQIRVAFTPYTNYADNDLVFTQRFLVLADGFAYPLDSEFLNILETLTNQQTEISNNTAGISANTAAITALVPTTGSYAIPAGSMINGSNVKFSTGVTVPAGKRAIICPISIDSQFFVTAELDGSRQLIIKLMNIYGGNTATYSYSGFTTEFSIF